MGISASTAEPADPTRGTSRRVPKGVCSRWRQDSEVERLAEDSIRRIFFTPAVAIARLGGSATPLDAFTWGAGDPQTVAETRIQPAWTLDVRPDGSVAPRLPRRLLLRDGPLLRPVAPFLELWALTGDGAATGDLRAVPVTTALLRANRASLANLTFTIDAVNRKAERRSPRGGGVVPTHLRFGTFPPVTVRGDQHRPVPLLASSPPDAPTPMIPQDRNIPLGQLQVLRPVRHPARPRWPQDVRIDVVRLRFTPARGRFYGPPVAAQPVAGFPVPAVAPRDAFLDPNAGWFGAPRSNRTQPADTLDEDAAGRSLGVVDDTCDAVLAAELTLEGGPLGCHANIGVAPPQYGSDRRPFLSLADELNDREHDPRRDEDLSVEELASWVEDLFERVYEVVTGMDVDWWRALAARPLQPDELRQQPISDDEVPQPSRAMGGLDLLRDPNISVPGPSPRLAQPLSQRARDRHRNLSDVGQLAAFVRANPDRMVELVRPPLGSGRDATQSMQMPPFMRNSNGRALSLARWQYDLLMAWVGTVTAPEPAVPRELGLRPLSPTAAERRRRVLDTLDLAEDDR